MSLRGNDISLWIGLSDKANEGTFVWANGAAVAFEFWKKNQPNDGKGNEDCVEMTKTNGKWDDVQCSKKRAFVCQKIVN